MKRAKVYMHENWAGTLIEDDEGFHYRYEEEYLQNDSAEPISLTLPLKSSTYSSKILFPFFDGLIGNLI
jgi:serine/threonine-protein kinase HipA